MAHIKKVVMQGFKSFPKKTEVPFDKGINVIIGPNGSGKSNISDAICFVLGRLSVKSLRAEKARNLIFMGSKYVKPSKEAHVEIVFDNEDRAFSIDKKEVAVTRIVRLKGQSIYKINGETKTRAEVIETLAQAGIDPYGFNIILQGQIQSIVKMHGEERRKIIGEVAGISVYEWRKEKSLKELGKTDERLKEISAVLRERTAYLNNLEKEKAQAQRYKDLQTTVRRAKASILKRKHDEKKKEVDSILRAISEKLTQRDKKQEKAEKTQEELDKLSERVNQINKHIKDATGFEQGKLREEITNFRAELEGLKVRKEGYENRGEEVEKRIEEMGNSIPELEQEIEQLREESPLIAKKALELKKKKQELAEFEKERRRAFAYKSELDSLGERLNDKRKLLARTSAESEALVGQIEELSGNLAYNSEKECADAVEFFKKSLAKEEDKVDGFHEEELTSERIISVSEAEMNRNKELKKQVKDMDVCPLCRSKISEEHIEHVFEDCDKKIIKARGELMDARDRVKAVFSKKEEVKKKITVLEVKIDKGEEELARHRAIKDKKELLKKSSAYEAGLKGEFLELEKKRRTVESKTESLSKVNETYETKMLEIEEISSRTEEDVDTTLLYKERELEKIRIIIERGKEDLQEIEGMISDIARRIREKETALEGREGKEQELNKKFERMFVERDDTQKQFQETSLKLSDMQGEIRGVEDQANYLKIGKAKLDGERETLEMDMQEYRGVEFLQGSVNILEEKLKKAQGVLESIGSINMRALEVYEGIKEEYDAVKEKADTLQKEKDEVLKIIEEIDKRKKKTFMKTFKAVNGLFSKNFSKLSAKGVAYLEVENPEEGDDVSEAGVNIVVKMAKGKYFDVSSLSGGEQALVAISLLFAIQEYKPYHFYILDEIDAALDKRNSERLAVLLDQYTKAGQYIIVTHNDAIILDSNLLYGVSMHEGVSKILSLKISEEGKDFGGGGGEAEIKEKLGR